MNRRPQIELVEYHHAELMDELNAFMIQVKTHLYDLKVKVPKPSIEEIDSLHLRIHRILSQDSEPLVKR